TRTLVAGDDDVFTVTLAASDQAENPMSNPTAGGQFTVDATPPAVSLTYNKSVGYCDGNTLQITATFTETLSGAPRISIGVGNVGGGPVSGVLMSDAGDADPKTWRFETIIADSDPTGDRTVTISATDLAGNPNTAAAPATFAIDNTHPSPPTLSFSPLSPHKAGTVTATAVYAEALSNTPQLNVQLGDTGTFSVASGVKQADEKTIVYTCEVGGTTLQDGTPYTATLNGAVDLAGNGQQAAAQTTGKIDTVAPLAPQLTFSKGPGFINQGELTVTADFVEGIVSAFTPTLAFSGTGGPRFSVGAVTRSNADKRFAWPVTVDVTATAQAGDAYTATVSAGQDYAFNQQAVKLQSGTVDTVYPEITSVTYNKEPFRYKDGDLLLITATFNEDVTPTSAKITLTGGVVDGSDVANAPMSPVSRQTWIFQATVRDSDGPDGGRTLDIDGIDAAGNVCDETPNNVFVVDNTHPAATITYDPTPLVAGPVWIKADFAETLAENPLVRVARDGTGVSDISPTAMVPEAGQPNPRYKFQYYLFPQDGTRLRDSMTVTVASTDVAGNTFSKVDTCTSASTPKLQTTTDFKIELRPGLNLISLPVKPAHLTAKTLFLDALKSAQMVARTTVDPITGESRFGVCLRADPKTDFELKPGYGYAVPVTVKSTLVLTGAVGWLPQERQVVLGNGPSLVGLPTTVASTAQAPITFGSQVAESASLLTTLGTNFLATSSDTGRTLEVALPVSPTLPLRPGKGYLTRLVPSQPGGVVTARSFMLPLPSYPGFANSTPKLPAVQIAPVPDRLYPENKNVTLVATASGPSGATYQWTQTLGPAVTLNTPTALSTSFTATRRADYAFTLTASVG
ncbi:MAG: hypothetical protein HY814_13285, partial [Candidatus Riflebacteria bacterium]|nr:hypothetical protein [Candidatus Riflebacteria bacterium]